MIDQMDVRNRLDKDEARPRVGSEQPDPVNDEDAAQDLSAEPHLSAILETLSPDSEDWRRKADEHAADGRPASAAALLMIAEDIDSGLSPREALANFGAICGQPESCGRPARSVATAMSGDSMSGNDPEVVVTGTPAAAHCTCGWDGDQHRYRADVEADGFEHLADYHGMVDFDGLSERSRHR